MASTGKKSKKVKGKTLALNDFLAATPNTFVTKSWANDEEDPEPTGYNSRVRGPVVLPSASRASRGGACDEDTIPLQPPYVAYMSNLPYELDEESILDLFKGLKVSNLRLPRESESKLRGFGYVDFDDRDSLIAAMNIPDLTLNGRSIRISVSTSDNDRRQGARRNDRERDREYDPERTAGNWRTTTRPDDSGRDENKREWGYNRDRGERSERREPSAVDNTPGAWREGKSDDDPPPRENRAYGGRGSYGDRDRGFGRDGDRGFGRDREGDRGFGRDKDGDRGFGRDRDSDRGFGRERDGDRDRGYRSTEFGRDRYKDTDRGYGRRDYGGDREKDRERDRDSDPDKEPSQRPKLQLKPRSIPLENPPLPVSQPESEKGGDTGGEGSEKEDNEKKQPPAPKPAANIFGSAKPVDTSAREREIEERLAKKQTVEPKYREGNSKDRDERKTRGRDRRNDREDEDRRPQRRSDDRRSNDERTSRSTGRGGRDYQDRRESDDGKESRDVKDSKDDESRERREYSGNREKEDREHRRDEEKPMPKAKEQAPPNFVASNKFSSLESADVEDEEVSE